MLTQWIANAVVVLFFPYAFNQIGKAVTFGFLAAMAITQAVVTWLWVPETKNKSWRKLRRAWAGNEASPRLPPNDGRRSTGLTAA